MAKAEPRSRIVIEPLAHFDLSSHSRSSVQSLTISRGSDSRAIFYVGTKSGTILSLAADLNNATTSAPAATTELDSSKNTSFLKKLSLLRSVSVSNSPVNSILVLSEIGKLLLLSDGSLFLVDSALSQSAKRLSFSKGISFATRRLLSNESESSKLLGTVNSFSEHSSAGQRLMQRLGGGVRANGLKIKDPEQHSEGSYVFAIVIGKRLIFVELVFGHGASRSDKDINGTSGSLVILKEIQCVDEILTMVWLNDSIIVGTTNGYSLISCVTGQTGVIFSLPDVSRPPCLKLLHKELKVLLLVDNVGIIADAHGQPVGGSLVFRNGLDSVGEISSYVVIVNGGKMELYHKISGACIQTLPFGGEGIGPCIVASEEEGGGEFVAVATATKVCSSINQMVLQSLFRIHSLTFFFLKF